MISGRSSAEKAAIAMSLTMGSGAVSDTTAEPVVHKVPLIWEHSMGGIGIVFYDSGVGAVVRGGNGNELFIPDDMIDTLAALAQPENLPVGYIDPKADFMLPRKGGCILSSHIDMLVVRDPSGKRVPDDIYTQPIYTRPEIPPSDNSAALDAIERWHNGDPSAALVIVNELKKRISQP